MRYRVGCLILSISLVSFALQAQPTNDAFTHATVISGWSGSITQSTAGATLESAEPEHGGDLGGASVWFVWEAPASGAAEFHLHLSDFDTTLSAYNGTALNTLEAVAQNDDAFDYFPLVSRWVFRGDQSHLRFPAQAGVRYHIAVDGTGGTTGNLRLNWSLHPAPANDNFAQAQVLTGSEGFLTTHNIGAKKEPGEPNHATNAGSASIWFRWTAPASGATRFYTLNSLTEASTPLDTLLGIYTGERVDALTQIAANDNNGTSLRSLAQFNAVAGMTYHIAVDTKAGGTNQNHGRIVLTWVNGVPTNNNLAAATRLSGACGMVQEHNTFATKESSEPAIDGNAGGASIWYVWTAPTDGDVVFTTQGSPFLDTLLAVYTGNTINSLSLVAENDDVSGGYLDQLSYSRVEFTANAGTTYKIAIDGFRSATTPAMGVVFLQWSFGAVTNDDFAAAQSLTGTRGTINACNSFATLETDEPLHTGNDGGRSLWYRWQAPATGVAVFDLAGSSFDTLLAVYRADGLPAVDQLASVAQSNDSFDGFSLAFFSRVEFAATAGATYFIAVDGANDGSGYISDGWLVMNYDFLPVPALQITRSGQSLLIDWSGPYTLESTTDLGAAWVPVPGTPPVSLPVTFEGNRFFRAVHP